MLGNWDRKGRDGPGTFRRATNSYAGIGARHGLGFPAGVQVKLVASRELTKPFSWLVGSSAHWISLTLDNEMSLPARRALTTTVGWDGRGLTEDDGSDGGKGGWRGGGGRGDRKGDRRKQMDPARPLSHWTRIEKIDRWAVSSDIS